MFSPENSDILFLCNSTARIPWNRRREFLEPVEIFFSSPPNNVLIKSFKPLPKLRERVFMTSATMMMIMIATMMISFSICKRQERLGREEEPISLNKIIIYHKKSHLTTRHIYHTIFNLLEKQIMSVCVFICLSVCLSFCVCVCLSINKNPDNSSCCECVRAADFQYHLLDLWICLFVA